jgi:hypothetical protein
LFFQLQKAMHEFGDKNYESTFMKIDSGLYNTSEGTTVLSRNDTTDLMHKQTDYSHPLVQYPLPGCVTHQRKRMVTPELLPEGLLYHGYPSSEPTVLSRTVNPTFTLLAW